MGQLHHLLALACELCQVELFKFDRIFVETAIAGLSQCLGPYHVESTSSRPITEVKQHRAALVLGWVTAWEYAVLYTFLYRPQNCYLTALQNLYQVAPRARVAQSVER